MYVHPRPHPVRVRMRPCRHRGRVRAPPRPPTPAARRHSTARGLLHHIILGDVHFTVFL